MAWRWTRHRPEHAVATTQLPRPREKRPGRRRRGARDAQRRLPGHQGPQGGGHRGRAHQPEHRDGADEPRGRVERRRRAPQERAHRRSCVSAARDGGQRAPHPGQGEEHRRCGVSVLRRETVSTTAKRPKIEKRLPTTSCDADNARRRREAAGRSQNNAQASSSAWAARPL